MNGIELTGIIKDGMTLLSPSISAIVGGIVSTLFLRKNAQMSEFEKIKAGKFKDVIEDLLNSGKMTYLEYYKCNNFLKIAKLADSAYQKRGNEGSNTVDSYDFDWFIRFFEYSSSISDEQMQEIWAKVLAREVETPNSTSITLLHALSMMRREQALAFCNISRFAFLDINERLVHPLIFVSSNRETYEKENITPSLLKELDRLGLVECNFSEEYIFLKKKVFKIRNKVIEVFGDPEREYKIRAGNVKFTRDGQLLYLAIDDELKKCHEGILNFTIEKFRKRNCRVVINDRNII